jgi:hypothetical protein
MAAAESLVETVSEALPKLIAINNHLATLLPKLQESQQMLAGAELEDLPVILRGLESVAIGLTNRTADAGLLIADVLQASLKVANVGRKSEPPPATN